MTLGELIKFLEAEDPDLMLPRGFGSPHSYRGYYEQLAFAPRGNVTVGEMLADTRSALGATYQGWKGGEYTMREYTECWIAARGDCGEGIGPVLLRLMVEAAELAKLRGACQALGRIVTAQARTFEAARIEVLQNGPEAAMQWILNSIPDVDDNDPEDQWNGTESAQEWLDRNVAADRAAEAEASR